MDRLHELHVPMRSLGLGPSSELVDAFFAFALQVKGAAIAFQCNIVELEFAQFLQAHSQNCMSNISPQPSQTTHSHTSLAVALIFP